jgi:hypothetical protein
MGYLAEFLVNALAQLFFGMAPERPVWLRRIVQAFWILFAGLVVVAWGYGLAMLLRAL